MERADEVLLPKGKAGADDNRFPADAGVDSAAHLALFHEDAEPQVEGANQLSQ